MLLVILDDIHEVMHGAVRIPVDLVGVALRGRPVQQLR
jgi:hypothetical protein